MLYACSIKKSEKPAFSTNWSFPIKLVWNRSFFYIKRKLIKFAWYCYKKLNIFGSPVLK
jgi:hypothetical protein